jgi:threonine synthase
MSGVNSINWVRIVAQIVYYFFSYFKISQRNEKINFSVPTGNFGDVYAGYVAKKMGLPINKLIVATNSNDILKRVINCGIYKPSKVKHTISPSIDIQVASNFERLIFDICSSNSRKILKIMNDLKNRGKFKLDKKDLNKIKRTFCSDSLSDKETKLVIKKIFQNQELLIDPHTAVAIGVAKKISLKGKTIVLSTAHPSKFFEVVLKATNIKSSVPSSLKNILVKKEKYVKIPKDLSKVKKYILSNV